MISLAENNEAVSIAIEAIRRFETVIEVSENELRREGIDGQFKAFKSPMYVRNSQDEVEEVAVYIVFLPDFPYSMPAFRLSQADFDQIYPIPHLDKMRHLCTYLRSETDFDENDPAGVLESCYAQAVKTLGEGIRGENVADYEDEFLVYWEEGEHTLQEFLCLAQDRNPESLQLIRTNRKVGPYQFFLVDRGVESRIFTRNLASNGNSYDVVNFALDLETDPTPPFDATIGQFFDSLGDSENEVKKQVNRGLRYILRSKIINDRLHYFAYKLPEPRIPKAGGFRKNRFSDSKALLQFQEHSNLKRIYLMPFSKESVSIRSSGKEPDKQWSFGVAGVGSIGSNLIPFLDSMNFPDFFLFDPQNLALENIGRHLGGLSDVGENKASNIGSKLLDKFPLREVTSYKASIFDIFENHREEVNRLDALFVVIGIPVIERFVVSRINSGEIKVPTIFYWIEPHLAGGHVLYIDPNDPGFYDRLHENGLYRNNLIDQSAFQNPDLALNLRDAGCGSSYTPYGQADIMEFLGAIWGELRKLIVTPPGKSIALSWVGDLDRLKSQNIPLSPLGCKLISEPKRILRYA